MSHRLRLSIPRLLLLSVTTALALAAPPAVAA